MKRATLLSNGSETEMTTEDLSGRDAGIHIDYDAPIADDITTESGQHPDEVAIKIILVGDSAVGKSKLVERFLMEDYKPHQLSTYALTLFRYKTKIQQDAVTVDFWDTAGQERFQSLHPSYYHQAHCAILIFDSTRKVTYKNLTQWYEELRLHRPEIPCLCAANKIDVSMETTRKTFAFATKNQLPLYYVSASDGTNVVKLFNDAIAAAVAYKRNPTDVTDQIMHELEKPDTK